MGNCVTTQDGLECIDTPLYPITTTSQPLVTTTTVSDSTFTPLPRTGSDSAEYWAFIGVVIIIVGVCFVLAARALLRK